MAPISFDPYYSVLVYGISRPQIHVKNLILNLSNQSSSPGDIQTISNTLLIHHETFKMRTRCLHGSIARLFQLESFERWCAVYGFPNSQRLRHFCCFHHWNPLYRRSVQDKNAWILLGRWSLELAMTLRIPNSPSQPTSILAVTAKALWAERLKKSLAVLICFVLLMFHHSLGLPCVQSWWALAKTHRYRTLAVYTP